MRNSRRAARELTDPIARGVLVTRELGTGYTQTQPGPAAIVLEPSEIAAALAFEDDRPPADKIHRVELTPDELEQLEDLDPELES